MKRAVILNLCLVAMAQAQIISDRLQSVGGGGRWAGKNSDQTGLPHGMIWLKEAEVIEIQKDKAGKPYLLLDQHAQTYRIRGFPDGTYKAGDKINSLFLVRGKPDPALGGRMQFLWFATNEVTQRQILQHEMSAMGALYPIN